MLNVPADCCSFVLCLQMFVAVCVKTSA
jgi:hypothetical protein